MSDALGAGCDHAPPDGDLDAGGDPVPVHDSTMTWRDNDDRATEDPGSGNPRREKGRR